MKHIDLKSFSIRFLISFLASVISSFGIGCYYCCGLGTDPISVFVDGLHGHYGLSYGTISTICNIIQTVLIFLFIRKHLGPGTLLGVLTGGPFIDLSETLMRSLFPAASTPFFLRIFILLLGLVTTGIGYGMGIGAEMGIGCFQFLPLFLSEKTPLELKYTQIITDALFFITGFFLGGVVGIGSIISVLLTGFFLDIGLKRTLDITKDLSPWFK
ncbi:MAG: hypothetical protein K5648_06505 [Erysipelotrichaceae bacterium]|nr:hypothetical protein [Erysipelotrichaceae bacterium]